MRTLYCLQCEHDRFYIGETPDGRFETRLYEHMYKRGAKWTTRHKPINVMWTKDVADVDVGRLEDEECCAIMRKFGLNSCRGGLFNIGKDVHTLPWWAGALYKEHKVEILSASA